MLGYPAAEIIGKPISLLSPPAGIEDEGRILEQISRGDRVEHLETVRKTRDGRLIYVSLTAYPVTDSTGRVVSASTILRDTTDRKRSESALQDSETRHRAILDASLDGIVTIDEKGVIESINPAGQRLFGYTAQEVVGQNVNMLMPEPYRGEHDQYLRNYRTTGQRKIIGIGREVVGHGSRYSSRPTWCFVSLTAVGVLVHFSLASF